MRIATGKPAEAVLIGSADHVFEAFQPALDAASACSTSAQCGLSDTVIAAWTCTVALLPARGWINWPQSYGRRRSGCR